MLFRILRQNASILIAAVVINLAAFFYFHAVDKLRAQSYEVYTSMIEKWWEKGPLVAMEKEGEFKPKLVKTGILIQASPKKVWDVLTDIENFPKTTPDVTSAKIVEKGKDFVVADVKIDVQLIEGVSVKANTRMKFVFKKPHRMEFKQVSGDFGKYEGYWQIIPVSGGKKTLFFYVTAAESRNIKVLNTLYKDDPNWEMVVEVAQSLVLIKGVKKRAEST